MIRLNDIHVRFNQGTAIETHALRGLSLEIPVGQFVTVIGSNGSGKSTMLNAVSGEIIPMQGNIVIGDDEVTAWPPARRARVVARVFQDPMAGTCEALTIEENLALAQTRGEQRKLRTAIGKSLRDKFRERLAILGLGLENRLEDTMGLLSGGQRQAVSLMMATLNPLKILLLDEHTAALDPKTAAFVLELTDRFVGESQLTTLMVTHSMAQALDHGQRTVMLHEGKVILDVHGEQRRGLKVEDLLQIFEKVHGERVTDDTLLLG